MLADALGRPLRFLLTGGQVHDIVPARAMIEGVDGGALITDKAYDSNAFREEVARAGMRAVILPAEPAGSSSPRSRAIQTAQSDRAMLQQAQAFPPLLNPLRPPRCLLSRLHPHRRRHDMDALNVDSA